MEDAIKQIGQRLKGLREVLDIPAEEVAQLCEIPLEHYMKIEAGEADPSVYRLSRISKRYGIALFHNYEVSKRTSLYAGVGYDRQEYDDKYDGGKEHLEQDSVQAGIGIVHNF